MRILLVSEGSHEGHLAPEKPQALKAIVQRVLPAIATYKWISVRDLPRGNPLPGKGGGHFKLALKAMWHATQNGYDAVILITDADGKHDRISEFDEAQKSSKVSIPRALGIPVEEFDAWILADEQALSQALGQVVPTQPAPEALRHPKDVCRAVMQTFGWNATHAEFYERVCKHLNLNTVGVRCPKGFQPFLERLRALATLMS